ncbi:MAG: TetR/AcrR family transcriptional regulator [Nitrososphaeria archaeon]
MNKQKTFDTLRKKQADHKKKIILKAAESLFANKSFKEISMREIAKAAGISHATIYRYFADQQTLFIEILIIGIKKIENKIQCIIEEENPSNIQKVAEAYVSFLFEHNRYFKMMTNFMLDGNIDNQLIDKINEIIRSLLNKFEILLKQAGVENNTRLLTHSFFAALNGILITFYNYPGRPSDEVKQHMMRLALIITNTFTGKNFL